MKRNQKWAALAAAAVLTIGAFGTAGAAFWEGTDVNETVTGRTFTAADGEVAVDSGAKVTFKDCNINVAQEAFTVNAGTAIVEGGAVTSGVYSNYLNKQGGGTVEFTDTAISGDLFAAQGAGSTISVSGGSVDVKTIKGTLSCEIDGQKQEVPEDAKDSYIDFEGTTVKADAIISDGGEIDFDGGTTATIGSMDFKENKDGSLFISDDGTSVTVKDVNFDGTYINVADKSTLNVTNLTMKNGANLELNADSEGPYTYEQGKGAVVNADTASFDKSHIYVGIGSQLTAKTLTLANQSSLDVFGEDASFKATGKTESSGQSTILVRDGASAAFADITVKDGTENGQAISVVGGGKMTSGALNATNVNVGVKGEGSSYTFTGGTVSGGELYADNSGVLTIKDATISTDANCFTTEDGTIEMTGGTVTSGVWVNGVSEEAGAQGSFTDAALSGEYLAAQGKSLLTVTKGSANVTNVYASKDVMIDDKLVAKDVAQAAIVFDGTTVTADTVTLDGGALDVTGGAQMTSNTLLMKNEAKLSVEGAGTEYVIKNGGTVTISQDSDVDAAITVDAGTLRFKSGSELYVNGEESDETAGANGIALLDLADDTAADGALQAVNKGKIIFENGSSVHTTADENHVVGTVASADETSSIVVEDKAQLFVSNAVADEETEYDFSNVVEGSDAAFKQIYGKTILVRLNEDGKTFGETEDVSAVLPDVFAAAAFTAANIEGSGDAYDFVTKVLGQDGDSDAKRTEYLNQAAGLTGLVGVSHGTYGFAQRVADLALRHEAEGQHIWASYLREDRTVDGFKVGSLSTDYDLSYNGFILGGDFAKTENSVTGAAFAYADGDVSSNGGLVSTKNDAKYYAGEIYHIRKAGDVTFRAGVGYMRSSNELTQANLGTKLTGKTDASAVHAGIRAEKAVETAGGTWAPYIGLDYFHVSADDYTDSLGFRHDTESANIWNLPVGVQYRHEVKSGSWTLAPIVEIGYLFALGDKDVNETYGYGDASSVFASDIAENSFIGKLGFAAKKDAMSYELHYGYQKGSDVKSNQWGVQISYAF